MIEVEVKLPLKDKDDTARQLKLLHFCSTACFREEDTYFDNAASQMKNSHAALRIRKVTDCRTGAVTAVTTYKSRRLDAVSSTRKEYETEVKDAEVFASILNGLGFYAVEPQVIKIRQEYSAFVNGYTMNACLDQVENLGSFLELEIVIEDGDNREKALAEIEKMLEKLGYSLADTTTRSYLSQLQKKL